MDEHIIDCCSLLNLYTGWGGLADLRELRWTWYVCEAVLNEAEYTREYGADGVPVLIPLDIRGLIQSGILHSARPETKAEIDDYVSFACEVDDGEAQALAIAKHRGFVLLTDDRKAARIAQRPDVAVRITSTAKILQAWAQLDTGNEVRLREVITRIAGLARFSPSMDSPDCEWWRRYSQG